MTSGWVLAAAIVPALVCALVIAMLRGSRLHAALADQPNERSLHVQPRPRVGGIGVMVAALASGLLLADGQVKLVLLLAAALSVVSFADDRASLPIAARLLAHIAAAAAIAFTCIGAASWPLAIVATLAIAWMTNLFNFMDGSDGLAGGMGTIGFGAYAAAAAFAHDLPFALGCLVLASACAGFLLHNFPPARVFMGDTGSIPLGFLAGALGTLGAVRGLWAWWFPVLAFAPFILDASVTLARRAVKRERIWRAHRSHSYQRLVLSGWSHRKLAMHAYALMLLSAACALAAQRAESPMRWAIIWGWAAVLLALFGSLERRFARTASSPLPGLDP